MNSRKFPYLLFIGLFTSTVALSGCFNKPPVDSTTDSNTQTTDTSTNTDSQKPPVDTSTDVTPPVKDEITFDEFLEKHPEIAKNFAEEIYSQISYIKDALSTHYSFVEKDGKIEKIIVANVVETGETERQLKIATINIIPAVEIEDIVEDRTDDLTISIEAETVMTFDAKENYINDTFDVVETEIDKLVEQHLGDQTFTTKEYEKEDFTPQTVEELVKDYPEKVNEILNETCFDALIKKCVTLNYNPDNIISAKWYLEGEKEITGVGLLVNYRTSDGDTSYRYGKAKLIDSVSINDFINKKNIKVESAKREYFFSYIGAQQGTRDDLVNAIFEVNGMSKECPEGAIRLFKDGGDQLEDFGQAREFIVVEISAGRIEQFGIRIKKATTDQAYIKALGNKENYRICNTYTESIFLEGQELSFKKGEKETQIVEPAKAVLTREKKEFELISRNL